MVLGSIKHLSFQSRDGGWNLVLLPGHCLWARVITCGHPLPGRPETVPVIWQWCNNLTLTVCLHTPNYLAVLDSHIQHVNSPKALILQHVRHLSRGFLLNEMSGKSKTDCWWIFFTPFLWSTYMWILRKCLHNLKISHHWTWKISELWLCTQIWQKLFKMHQCQCTTLKLKR